MTGRSVRSVRMGAFAALLLLLLESVWVFGVMTPEALEGVRRTEDAFASGSGSAVAAVGIVSDPAPVRWARSASERTLDAAEETLLRLWRGTVWDPWGEEGGRRTGDVRPFSALPEETALHGALARLEGSRPVRVAAAYGELARMRLRSALGGLFLALPFWWALWADGLALRRRADALGESPDPRLFALTLCALGAWGFGLLPLLGFPRPMPFGLWFLWALLGGALLRALLLKWHRIG